MSGSVKLGVLALLLCGTSAALGEELKQESRMTDSVARRVSTETSAAGGILPARVFFVPTGMDPSMFPMGVSVPVPSSGGDVIPVDAYIQDLSGSGLPLERFDVRLPCETASLGPPGPPVTIVPGSAFIDAFRPEYVFFTQGSADVSDVGQCELKQACVPGSCPGDSLCLGGFCGIVSPRLSGFTSPPNPVFDAPAYLGSFALDVPVGATGPYEFRPVCCVGDAECDGVPDGGCPVPGTLLNTTAAIAMVDGLLIDVGCSCNGDVAGGPGVNAVDVTCVLSAIGDEGLCPGSDVNCDGTVDLRDVEAVSCQVATFAGNSDCCMPATPGACCFNGGSQCAIGDVVSCASPVVGDGVYLGDNTTCVSDPCDVGGEDTISPFETATVSPAAGGGVVDPRVHAFVRFANQTASGGSLEIHETAVDLHPGATGQPTFGETVSIETSIPNGQFKLLVSIPFERSELAGESPLSVHVNVYDEMTNSWDLTVEKNTVPSPGFTDVVGDKIVMVGGETPSIAELFAFDVGDYGIYWDPDTQGGLAWAIQDHTSDNRNGRGSRRKSCETNADCVLVSRDVCTHHTCVDSICEGFPVRYGDLRPPYGQLVQTNDILAAVAGFGDYFAAPNSDLTSTSIPTCVPSGIPIGTEDILETVDAFGGADPCGCGFPNLPTASSMAEGVSRRQDGAASQADDRATFTLLARDASQDGALVDVDLWIDGVEHVGGVGIALDADGVFVLEDAWRDSGRQDDLFADGDTVIAKDLDKRRVAVVATDIAINESNGPLYVCTIRVRLVNEQDARRELRLDPLLTDVWRDQTTRIPVASFGSVRLNSDANDRSWNTK